MKKGLDLQGYDSKEELYFSWWLDDAKKVGIVSWHSHPKAFDLTRGTYYNFSGVRKSQHTLARPHTYTPDFLIVWDKEKSKSLIKVLHNVNNELVAFKSENKKYFWVQKYPYEYSSYIDMVS